MLSISMSPLSACCLANTLPSGQPRNKKYPIKQLTHRILKTQPPAYVTRFEYKGVFDDLATGGKKHVWHGLGSNPDDLAFVLPRNFHINDTLSVTERWGKTGDQYIYGSSGDNPPSTMPMDATRFYLKVTDTGFYRIKDITQEIAEAEGLYKTESGWIPDYDEWKPAYIHQWNERNPDKPFKDNPWVQWIRFKLIEVS
jgi:hypothetical protein